MTQQEAHRIAISGLRFNFNINLQYNNGNYSISAPDLLDLLEYDLEYEISDYNTNEQLHSTVSKISQRYLAVA